jgi:tetratricopeptide (TPR) repeat protein
MRSKLLALAALGCALPALAAHEAVPTGPGVPSRRALEPTIAAYRAQLVASPNDAVAHNKLGVCYQQTRQLKLARKEYEKAVELNPRYAQAWNNLGTLEHARGKYKKAIAHYRKAISLEPQHATFHRNLGAAWLGAGKTEGAIEAFGEALRLDPQSLEASESAAFVGSSVGLGDVYFTYAKLYASRGDTESALLWLGRARESGFRDFARAATDTDFAAVVKNPRYLDLAR